MCKQEWGNICNRVDSCALTGAAAFIAGIPGAEVLVNGPLWCYFYALRNLEHAQYNMGERFHNCQPDNNAIVYGAEKFLTEALERLYADKHTPELLFVESSCSLSLIGDDIAGIVRKQNFSFPWLTMDCGGLVGGFAEGYAKAAVTFCEKFVLEQGEVFENSINVLGLSDFYYNGAADRKEICRILKKAGYHINAVPGAGSSLENLKEIANVRLNVVCNEELGLKLAKYLKQRFGIPYILAGMPYGTEGSSTWIQDINAILPCENLQKVLDECNEEQQRLIAWNNDFHSAWGSLWFENVLIAAPATQALCMAQALRNEWADMGSLAVICQNSANVQYSDAADNIYVAGKDNLAIEDVFINRDNFLLLASSSENSLLRRSGKNFAFFNVAYPSTDEVQLIEQPFAGIKGSAYMLQRLWNVFISQQMLSR